MSDRIEDWHKASHVFWRKHGVEQLTLPLVMISKCREKAGSEYDLVIAAKRSATSLNGQLVHRDVLDERRSLLVYVLVLDDDVVQSKWIKHI